MTAKGHIVLSMTPVVAWYGDALFRPPYLYAIPPLLIGSLAPDIDEPGSYIGRRLVFVSRLLKEIGIKHRSITHNFFAPCAGMAFSYFLLNGIEKILFFYFFFGMLMHTIGDLLTKGGIDAYFWPLSNKTIRLLPKKFAFYTGSFTEYIFVFMLLILDGVILGARVSL